MCTARAGAEEYAVRGALGSTIGVEEQGHGAGVRQHEGASNGVPQYLREHYPGPAKGMTAAVWREVYEFSIGGVSMASRNDIFVDGKFSHMIDPKDGYPVRDARDARHCRLPEFIMPIIHPDMPTQVTITIENTIFDALDGRRLVDFGLVF